jgi:hypothetical protein
MGTKSTLEPGTAAGAPFRAGVQEHCGQARERHWQ